MGKKLLPLLSLTFVLITFSNNAGKEIGREQLIYYQINGRTDLVGIQVYDDYVVLKRTTDAALSSTELIRLSEVDSLETIANPAFTEMVKTYNAKTRVSIEKANEEEGESVSIEDDEQIKDNDAVNYLEY